MKNSNIFIDFSQIIVHRNLHTVKNGPWKYAFKQQAASIIGTRTLRRSSIFSRAGKLSCFGGVLDLVHLRFFSRKHGCQGSNFSEFVRYFFQFYIYCMRKFQKYARTDCVVFQASYFTLYLACKHE